MAKYNVNYACGHTASVALFGSDKERQSKIRWMETTLCPECYARQQAEKANKLIALTGSEKQIAWAQKIVATAFEKLGNDFSFIANETSASWWIDHRDNYTSIMYERKAAAEKAATEEKALSSSKTEIFKAAHAYTKKLVSGKSGVSYQATFGMVLHQLYKEINVLRARKAA